MLPHFSNVHATNTTSSGPIYSNLYDMHFELNHESKFDKDDILFIQENTVKYNLQRGKITITLNMLEECSITKFCAIFDAVKQVIISVHNPAGMVKRRITLDCPKASLLDFSFKQDWAETHNLVSLDVVIKYIEITSEIIS